jgi:tetratricopeptide (TPR) repeat protein
LTGLARAPSAAGVDRGNGAWDRIVNNPVAGAWCIVIAVWVAYLPAISGGFIWDDDAYVTENSMLTAADGLRRIWFSAHFQSQYFPLVYTTLRFERALWGLNPLGYHLVNACLHALNALLVWKLLKRLAVPGAWLAAAIFALHPVQVETVAWITELKNTQSTLFYLLALLAWMKFTDESGGGSARYYALAMVLHLLALFSKTTACTLPAPMLLVLWLRNQPVTRQRVIQVLPFVLSGIAMGLVSIWWEGHLGNYQTNYGLAFSPLERMLIATRAVWFYAGKVVWPANLTFSYPKWQIDPRDPWQYSWAAACVVAVAVLFRWRRATGRGPIIAAAFFAAVLSPMLGFVSLYTFRYTFVADHYQYLACLGPFAAFAAAAVWLADHRGLADHTRQLLGLSLVLALGVLTWSRAGVYHSAETLWRDTLEKNPDSAMAHINLAKTYRAQGREPQSEAQFREGLRLAPGEESIHYDFANMLLRAGKLDEAISEYQAELRLNPVDPDAHNNLGIAFYQAHRLEEAVAQFRASLQHRPDHARTHYNLANALAALHKPDEAIRECREAIRLDPDAAPYQARLRALTVK